MSTTVTQTAPAEAIRLKPLNDPETRNERVASDPTAQADEGENHGQGMDRATVLRLMSAAFSFFVAGVSDGSIGALIPYMLREYNISEAIVSSIYGANFFGWFFAAIANTHLSQYLDLGAMLALGAFFQVVAQTLRAWNPPFGLFVATFWIVSVGQAFQDAHANTYVAGVKGAHRWLALIHAMYMAGCLVGPFVATPIASAGEVSQWYLFYIFPLGIGIVNLAWCLVAFRDTVRFHDNKSNANVEDAAHAPAGDDAAASRNKNALTLMKKTIKTPSVWLLSMFYFFYIGAALTASGWVTQYLVEVRGGNLSQMGYVPAGFSGGCFLGRLLLAEPTYRFGERRMVFIYILLAVALQLVFWLVPNIIAASVAISFIGFFTGPLFATGMSVGSKLFSQEIHSTALALIFVVAQMGGSALPIITGVIASRSGVAILQPILVGVLAATGVSWLLVPHPKTSNAAFHQE